MKLRIEYLITATLINAIILFWSMFAQANDHAIRTIAYEASNQSYAGQVAVASVIKTRMKERKQTAEQVVYAPAQFSCWKDSKPTQTRKLSSKEIETAKKAWNQGEVWEYNHYAHKSINNYWTRKAKKSVVICSHIFYQL